MLVWVALAAAAVGAQHGGKAYVSLGRQVPGLNELHESRVLVHRLIPYRLSTCVAG